MRTRRFVVLALALLPVPMAFGASACSADSPAARVNLLELYTSQGCNSCPPAERWFAQIPPGDTLIPLAFHVDYWDKLGWKDLYSDHRNTERQQRYAMHAGDPVIYTPQVFLDGRVLREWQRGVPKSSAGTPRPAQAHAQRASRRRPARGAARDAGQAARRTRARRSRSWKAGSRSTSKAGENKA
jgi:hypothetical protein